MLLTVKHFWSVLILTSGTGLWIPDGVRQISTRFRVSIQEGNWFV